MVIPSFIQNKNSASIDFLHGITQGLSVILPRRILRLRVDETAFRYEG
jgi:hypothetical protein